MAHPAQRRWYLPVFTVAALVLMPLSVLLLSWQSIDNQIWSHLWETQMPRLLGNTLTLVVGVGVGVTVLGVSLAWLTSLCEFPGRRWLVIQKGQFRREQELDVTTADVTLPDAQTTLPSEMDQANGKWIPRLAVAAGRYDHLESSLGTMGIGTVDATGV